METMTAAFSRENRRNFLGESVYPSLSAEVWSVMCSIHSKVGSRRPHTDFARGVAR